MHTTHMLTASRSIPSMGEGGEYTHNLDNNYKTIHGLVISERPSYSMFRVIARLTSVCYHNPASILALYHKWKVD